MRLGEVAGSHFDSVMRETSDMIEKHICFAGEIDYFPRSMDDLTGYREEGFEEQKLFRLPLRAERRMLSLAFTKDLVVTDVGFYPRADGHLVERERGYGSHILVWCVRGSGWFSWGGKRREVRSMDVFWIPANEAHSYGASQSEPWQIYWVHAYGRVVDDLLSWISLSRSQPMTRCGNSHGLRRQFNALLQLLESGYADHTLLEMSRFFVSLTALLHVDARPVRELEQREKILKSMEQMRKTVAQPRALEEYAKAVGFSVSQYSYLFKRHFGISPMAHLAELRIQRAKELLGRTDLSIKEISWQLGFDDPLYFSRMFKKVAGVAPTKYRDEVR